MDYQKLLRLTGKITNLARSIAGGQDVSGFMVGPATLDTVSEQIKRLRELLDEYDKFMSAMHDEGKGKK